MPNVDTALLITNIFLVLVTASYVVLTWRIALAARDSANAAREAVDSARESVNAARDAAKASEATAAIAQAALPVEFDLSPTYEGQSDWTLTEVCLTATTSNVFVHSARIDSISYAPNPDRNARFSKEHGFDERVIYIEEPRYVLPIGLDVMAIDGSVDHVTKSSLPVLLHTGETIKFGLEQRPNPGVMAVIVATVWYSTSGGDPVRQRLVSYSNF